jgi:hypothetical protein
MFILYRVLTIFIIQPEEQVKTIGNTINNNSINVIKNEQNQPSSSTSNSDEHFNKLIDDKMKSMQDAFQLKFNLMENANKSTITNLQQEKAQNDEENKRLEEELAKLRAELKQVTDNNLNYDSPKDDDDDKNDINYDSPDNNGDANNDTNYDTECSDNEQDTTRNTSKTVHQNPNTLVPNEVYADPNYDSSDNEDLTNNICLD